MTCNVGRSDRMFRFIISIFLISIGVILLFVTNSRVLVVLFLAFGGVMLVTAIVRWCPFYVPFNINTTGTF